jgi:hypothetical protein
VQKLKQEARTTSSSHLRPNIPIRQRVRRPEPFNAGTEDYRQREYLTEREVERLMKAAAGNRYGQVIEPVELQCPGPRLLR